MKRVFIKTHNDLDAVGSVLCCYWANLPVKSVEYCDYNTVDTSVEKYITDYKHKEDSLIIPDICPTYPMCAKLDKYVQSGGEIHLYDHHKTREDVAKYPWAVVNLNKCGTELVAESFLYEGTHKAFVASVGAWDCWRTDSPYRTRGENLNSFLWFVGRDSFVEAFRTNPNADEESHVKYVIEHLNIRKKRYVGQVVKDQLKDARCYVDGFGNPFKIIFSSEYVSEVGHAVLDTEEDLKYVVIVNPTHNSCSLRARTGETDVSKIAKLFGGGGHSAASGFTFEVKEQVEAQLFSMLNSLN